MKVLLTGGTGFVGSHVLAALVAHGHRVTALVRSPESASKVRDAGAEPLIGDITDEVWVAAAMRGADATIHTASPGDATSPQVDGAVARAATAAYTGTGKVFLGTTGVWVWGSTTELTEESPFNPPMLVAWRPDIDRTLFAIEGARTAVVGVALVYGDGGGVPNLVLAGPRDASGALTTIGTGTQHWPTVHADDLADLYVRILDTPDAGGYYIAASGTNPTVRELTEAAATAVGATGVVTETEEETKARLGVLADALLLDQQASGDRARSLGWTPSGPSLVEELEQGSYRRATA